jgi:hypothetical protein
MANRPRGDNEARLDELGNDPGQVGSDSAGQSGDVQRLSDIEDASEESIEELAETDQGWEAAEAEGVEDAADHPERPVTLMWSTDPRRSSAQTRVQIITG